MLIGWICNYETRRDTFSLAAHRALFDAFVGKKLELTSREAIAALREESRGLNRYGRTERRVERDATWRTFCATVTTAATP
jgi:hypothetical protein